MNQTNPQNFASKIRLKILNFLFFSKSAPRMIWFWLENTSPHWVEPRKPGGGNGHSTWTFFHSGGTSARRETLNLHIEIWSVDPSILTHSIIYSLIFAWSNSLLFCVILKLIPCLNDILIGSAKKKFELNAVNRNIIVFFDLVHVTSHGRFGFVIMQKFFWSDHVIREYWDINFKTLIVFLFLNFIYLPFFSKSLFSP